MPELDDTIIAVLLVAGIALLAIVLVVVFRRGGRRRLEALAPAFELGTTRLVGPFGTAIEGIYQGFSCRYTVEHASQYNPGGATLRVQTSSPLQWSAGVEDFGARLMVRVGILRDVEVGDERLDQRLRFSSTDQTGLTALFGQERTRSAMGALSDTDNFNSVTVRSDRADIKWSPRRPQLDENPDVVRARLDAVVELLSACGYSPRIG
jgi:hypothetical protein